MTMTDVEAEDVASRHPAGALRDGEQLVELPSGWAVIRKPSMTPERKRRAVYDAQIAVGRLQATMGMPDADEEGNIKLVDIPQEMTEAGRQVSAALIVALVRKWSLVDDDDKPLPITLDTLVEEVGIGDYDALVVATAPLFFDVMPDFGVKLDKPEGGGPPQIDEGSPTQP